METIPLALSTEAQQLHQALQLREGFWTAAGDLPDIDLEAAASELNGRGIGPIVFYAGFYEGDAMEWVGLNVADPETNPPAMADGVGADSSYVGVERQQCAGSTKAGTRCTRLAPIGEAYCSQHADQSLASE